MNTGDENLLDPSSTNISFDSHYTAVNESKRQFAPLPVPDDGLQTLLMAVPIVSYSILVLLLLTT